MEKDDLKSLVTQIFNDILTNIDAADKPSQKDIAQNLQNASVIIQNMSIEHIDSTAHAKMLLEKSYKEIAEKSIDSYKRTSDSIEKIAKHQEDTLQKCHNNLIDLPAMSEKFSNLQSELFEEITRANETIVELTEEIKTLEKSTMLDSLTKIYNRRALDQYLQQICTAENFTDEFHLLLLDIDDFKTINDSFGHLAGDKILIFLANLLRKTLRDGDKVFRYGGEEFVITLNRVQESTCLEISHRILRLIQSSRLVYKGESLNITVSIGATRYKEGDTPEAIINRADKALYRSKNLGKNQMHVELEDGV